MWNTLYPHYLIDSVLELTPEQLRALDVSYLLLDVDCTLKRYSNQEPEPEVFSWLNLLTKEGFRLCLLSNGVGRRISVFANLVGLPYVAKACKPLPFGCKRAMKEMNFAPEKTLLVGDQVFADIMAGRLAGIRTALTTPIAPEEEHWFTRMKRPFEKIALCSFRKKFPDGVWRPKKRK